MPKIGTKFIQTLKHCLVSAVPILTKAIIHSATLRADLLGKIFTKNRFRTTGKYGENYLGVECNSRWADVRPAIPNFIKKPAKWFSNISSIYIQGPFPFVIKIFKTVQYVSGAKRFLLQEKHRSAQFALFIGCDDGQTSCKRC